MRALGAARAAALAALALLLAAAPASAATGINYVEASYTRLHAGNITASEAAVFPLKQFWFNVTIHYNYTGWLVIPVPAKLAKEFVGSGVWVPGHKAVVLYDPVDELADLWIYGNWSTGVWAIKGYLGPGGRAYNYSEAMSATPAVGSLKPRDLVVLPLYLYQNPDIVIEEHDADKPNWLLNIPGGGAWRLAAWIPSASNGLIISKEGANNTGWGIYFDGLRFFLEVPGPNGTKRYPVVDYWLVASKLGMEVPVNVVDLKVFYMRDYGENGPQGDWQAINPPPAPNTEPLRIKFYGTMSALWLVYGDFEWRDTLILLVPRVGVMSPQLSTAAARLLAGRVAYVGDVDPRLWGHLGGPIVYDFLKPELGNFIAIVADRNSIVWLVDGKGYRRGGYAAQDSLALIDIQGFKPEKIVWLKPPSKLVGNTTIHVAVLNGYGVKTVYWPWALIAAIGAGLAALYLLRRR